MGGREGGREGGRGGGRERLSKRRASKQARERGGGCRHRETETDSGEQSAAHSSDERKTDR